MSRSLVVKLISCLPKSNKGMKDDYLITSGDGTMVSTAPPKRESQVGYLRVRFLSKTLQILQSSSYSYCSLFGFILMMGFRELIMALFLAVICRQEACCTSAQLYQRSGLKLLAPIRDFCERGLTIVSRSLDFGFRAHFKDFSRDRSCHQSRRFSDKSH